MYKGIGRKIIILLIICSMSLMSMPVFSEEIKESGSVNLNEGILELKLEEWTNKELVISSTVTNITINGPAEDIPGLTIKIDTRSTDLNLTINNLKASGSGNRIDISNNTAVTNLTLQGNNTLNSSDGNGIAVYTGNTLVINGTGDLNIQAGTNAAGIGGRYYTGAGEVKKGNGNIKINSGTINVTGGQNAAAIGSSTDENGTDTLGYIIINGGNISAIGGDGGAAIGSGKKRNVLASSITINGGNVKAVGGAGGAGIGSGAQSAKENPYVINITGGTISAEGKDGGAGIGGGKESKSGDINISGGKILKAIGSGTAAGIGGGDAKDIDTITINGTAHVLEVIGGDDTTNGGAGIGGSGNGYVKNIVIGGNAIIEKIMGGPYSAGIGGGAQRGFDSITVTDNAKIIYVKAGTDAAGIGTGGLGNNGAEKIYLLGGEIVEVYGGNNGAGIGAGNERGFELIKIDGTVIGKVVGGSDAAGIGTGPKGAGTNNKIVISSELYVDADDDVNAIGGGKDRLTHGEVTIDSVIMMGNNTITKVTSDSLINYANVAFCCINVDGTTATNIKFELYNKNEPDKTPNPETNGEGIVFSWVPIGVVSESKKLATYDYYFKIEDTTNGKVFFAKESGRSTYNYTDAGGNTSAIPLIYVKFAETKFDLGTYTPIPINGSKIIPYSLSTISYEFKLDKPVHDATYLSEISAYESAHGGTSVVTDEIQDNKLTLKLKPVAGEATTFDLTKGEEAIRLAVYEVSEVGGDKTYTYDKTLTAKINEVNPGTEDKVYISVDGSTKIIAITIPNEMKTFDKGYRIDIMCEAILNKKVNEYITSNVEGTDKIKDVEMINYYYIKTVTPWDGTLLEQYYDITNTSTLHVNYAYLLKIS